MRRLNSEFTTNYISEAGSKQLNKDYFGFVEMDNFACWALAESYDNDVDIISAQLVVDTVLDMFTHKPTLSKRRLTSYVKEAHRQLKHQSSKYRLKASILVVATDYKRLRFAVCGNSKLHIFRGDNIFTKSKDQSLYQDMIDENINPDDGERGMEESRNLFEYLGKQGNVKIKVSKKIILQNEDILLMTTWGFWEKISTIEMLDALDGANEPMQFLDELQDLFLSKQGRTVNNYTAVGVFANKIFQEKNNTKKIVKIVLMITIPLLIIGIILFFYFRRVNSKRIEVFNTTADYEQQGDTYVEDVNFDRALEEYNAGIKESKALKATKGKKGLENKEIKDRLTIKQRVAQLVIDGEKMFEQGKYTIARSNYEKALKETKNNMDFYEMVDLEELESRLILCDNYEYTDNLMKLASTQMDYEDYEAALQNYKEAKKIAAISKNKDAEKDIKLKIDEINTKLKVQNDEKTTAEKEEAQKAVDKKIIEAGIIELDGDSAVTSQYYALAAGYYEQAIHVYKETGSLDKAIAVEKKIVELNAKIKLEEDSIQMDIADSYIKMADDYMLDSNFDEAMTYYKYAKDIYSQLKNADKIVEVNELMRTVKDAKKDIDTSQKILDADFIKAEGDELLKKADYYNAKEKYKQARALYQGINQLDKVLGLENDIRAVDDLVKERNEKVEKELQEKKQSNLDSRLIQAKLLEIQAQQATKEGKYTLANDLYNQANEIYKELGNN